MSGESADGWTRAALVVGGVARRDGAVLLVHEHTLGGDGPDQWLLPGGRVEPGELLDAAVKREVEEETGLTVSSIGSLAFGSQHYAPGREHPLLFLAFHVEVDPAEGDWFEPRDPDGLIMEARFVPVGEAIDLVLSAGVFPGSQSTADFLARSPSDPPTLWLWDLNQSTKGPLAQLPGPEAVISSAIDRSAMAERDVSAASYGTSPAIGQESGVARRVPVRRCGRGSAACAGTWRRR